MTPAPAAASPIAALERRLIVGIIAATLILMAVATGVISRAALTGFEREVVPELGREATAVGRSLAAQIERALALGIPPDKLVGLEPFFEQALDNRPALQSIRFVTPLATHQVQRPGSRAGGREIRIAVAGADGPVGTLTLGINSALLERAAADSRWDIAIVLLVALLTTVEALVFLTDRTIVTPLRLVERLATRIAANDWTTRAQTIGTDAAGRFLARLGAVVRRMNERRTHLDWLAAEVGREAPQARSETAGLLSRLLPGARFASTLNVELAPRSAAVARAPLFLYLLAEQLSTSFIPIFAKSLPPGGIPPGLAAAVPITVFAATIALASPFAAALATRAGARTTLALGCLPAMLGYLLCARAGTVEAFTVGRAVTALGYAAITIACQTYLVAAGNNEARGRTMAVFVTAAMTGALCGTAIGAVLADRLGYPGTFAVSAAITAVAGALTLRTMDRDAGRRGPARPGAPRGAVAEALRSRRFVALVLFAAIPAKLVLAGVVFTISPLFLLSLGDSQPEIGREVMLYAGAMLLTIRAGAWFADRLGRASDAIAAAGALTGVALLLPLIAPAEFAVPLAIAATGLAQGLASAPMLAVVPELCPALAARLGLPALFGFLRLAERLGSIAGPLLAAVLAAAWGFAPAIAVFGAVSLAATMAYWAMTRSRA